MNIKNYLRTVNKQLKHVSKTERKKILAHLRKNLQKLMKKKQENTIVDKLGNPSEYGKSLDRHYQLLKTTDEMRLVLDPVKGKNGNHKRHFLRDIKFIISADMVLPVPTSEMWILGGISCFFLGLFIFVLYMWQMWALFWVLAPAFIANGAALLSRRIIILKPLAIPIDLEKKWSDGRRIIGNSKTIRGFVFGIFASVTSAIVIFFASQYFGINVFSSLNFSILFGAVLGFGALLGDAVKSFFKRRIGLKEGKNLIFFDQTDFLFGAILISLPFDQFPLKFILVIIAATFIVHIIMNIIAFYLKLKKVPW
jgi:CDP-2,3-bis-(O-geranylgeranyl)-sn-glycerol synthase